MKHPIPSHPRPTAAGIRLVHRRLASALGVPAFDGPQPLLDVLVATILSQNTSDQNSLRAFDSLKAAFPRWDLALQARRPEIAAAIRSGGLAGIKSRRIQRLLRMIKGREKTLSLQFLTRMPPEKAYQYLLSIDGVGPKTAACTLLFGAGIPAFPVDTHVYRVSGRLGWLLPRESREQYQERVRHVIPKDLVYPMHLNLIEHGRRTCHPRNPACAACRLNNVCQWRQGP